MTAPTKFRRLSEKAGRFVDDALRDPAIAAMLLFNEESGAFRDLCLKHSLTGTLSGSGSLGYKRPLRRYRNARALSAPSSQSFSVANNSTIQLGDFDFTYAFWVMKTATTAGAFPGPLSKRDGASDSFAAYVGDGDNAITWLVSSTGSGWAANVGASLGTELNRWHLVILWHDSVNNTINAQVDNGTPATTAHSGGVYAGTADLTVGIGTGGQYWTGNVGPIGYWRRVLTSAERAALYCGRGYGPSYAQLSMVEPTLLNGLRAWWDMAGTSGANEPDSVGSSTLVASNAPGVAPGVILLDPHDFCGVDFDGSNTAISLGDVDALDFESYDPFSLTVIGNCWKLPSSEWVLFSKCSNNVAGWKLDILSDGSLAAYFFNSKTGTTFASAQSSTLITPGRPFMAGLSWNGAMAAASDLKLFLDGVEVSYASRSVSGSGAPVMANGHSVMFGDMASGGGQLPSALAAAVAFSAAKSPAEFKHYAYLAGFLGGAA